MYHQYVFCWMCHTSKQMVKTPVSPEQYMRDMATGGYQVLRISNVYCYYCNKSELSILKNNI